MKSKTTSIIFQKTGLKMTANKPIIFLDIDGVLNPFSEPRFLKPLGFSQHNVLSLETGRKYKMWLNPLHGEWLKSLNADLVWATTWDHDAYRIGSRIGLSELPIALTEMFILEEGDSRFSGSCGTFRLKSRAISDYAGERPFIWIDDDHENHDRGYLNNNHFGRNRLLKIDCSHGLQPYHISLCRAWLEDWALEDLKAKKKLKQKS